MAGFFLLEKKLDLERIDHRFNMYAKCAYALPVRLSKPLAKDGYGRVTVDGIEISKGKPFTLDLIVNWNCLLIPVGEVAREYDREYTVAFSGFVAADGSRFRNQSFKIRTLPRRKNDHSHDEHEQVALQAAAESMVLLKNDDHTLPLREDCTFNCFGADQFCYRISPTGAGMSNPRWTADFHQAVEEHSCFTVNHEVSRLYKYLKNNVPTEAQLQAAREKSDIALIFLSRTSGEFFFYIPIKGQYYLTDEEEAMIAAVSTAFSKTVAIINSGYPIDVRFLDKYNIKAAIYTGYAGMCSAYALCELLDGRQTPCGKLPDTWALDYYDYPSAKNFPNFSETDDVPNETSKSVQIPYEEDIYIGYRYFDSFEQKAAFCFGHGLSYTTFSHRIDAVTADRGNITAIVIVKNCGDRSGKEVLQLYVAAPQEGLEKPKRVLAGFEKSRLLVPGEAQTMVIEAKAEDYAFYNESQSAYVLEAGNYQVQIGNSLDNAAPAGTFEIAETIREPVHSVGRPTQAFHRLSKAAPFANSDCVIEAPDKTIPYPARRKTFTPKPLKKTTDRKISFKELCDDVSLLDDFVLQLSTKELCRLNVSAGAEWYFPWSSGLAGKTAPLKNLGVPVITASDGSNGVNISKPNIGFPCSTNIAATFNKELAFQVGRCLGEESKENGVAINLGPAMNMHRNILCGRHPEYFSEDPFLAGTMAGYHGKGLECAGTFATYKHMFCNNSDTARKRSHSIVSERALREIYFRVFAIACRIQMPSCMMTSYNALNGIYPAENAELLQTLIREEWGFDGMIMTDWCSYDTIDPVEIVKAGTSWLTEGGKKYVKILYRAVKDGRLADDILRDNAKYLLKTLIKAKANQLQSQKRKI